jgi:signal transduction histidine kinase/DNA-binding response OmpR family regulator
MISHPTQESFQTQVQADKWADEMKAMFKQLQDETLVFTLPAAGVIGICFLAATTLVENFIWCLVLGVSCVVLAAVGWQVRKFSFRAASWLLIAGVFAANLVSISWGRVSEAVFMLILPVGLATLTLGIRVGAGTAAAASLILLTAPAAMFPVALMPRLVSLLTVWIVLGLIWLTLRPLLTSVQWAWTGYRSSQELLAQSREYQVKLSEMVEDLTEANSQLLRLNQLTSRLRKEAEDERRIKEEFVANVSHELRTPLNMIIGFCGMILNAPATYGERIPAALLADLEVVLRNSQHLSSLIDDVLDLSQIDANRMALTKEYVSLAEIIEAAVSAVRPLFSSKNLSVECEIPPDLPDIWCDRTRIGEVMLNLFSNAGRFTEKGGIHVAVTRDGAHVVVSVADTGPGIGAEDMQKIFRPFQQADGSIRRRYGGSGLGLSISKSIIELHDGKMGVESRKGKGTTFFFQLPIDPLPQPSSSPARWLTRFSLREERARATQVHAAPLKPRVVVAEHGAVMQRMLERYFQNVEVVAAPTLDAALAEAARSPAQALLVNDIQVDRVMERLKEADALPYSLPAIVCSLPGVEQAYSQLGVSGYLVKPINREMLQQALEKIDRPVETILLVDDEPDARQLFRRMLASFPNQYRVLRASDGAGALQILRAQPVDVVLLDLLMPKMDGFQFLAVKNQEPLLRSVPVILISARDPQGHPIASNALAVTRGGGMSMNQVLACIEALSSILGSAELSSPPAEPSAAPPEQSAAPGPPAAAPA